MATLPSRRDSRRTKGDYLRLVAVQAVQTGETLEQFVGHFKAAYHDSARQAFKAAQKKVR